MSETPQTPTSGAADPQLSHLASLHRMSRTAGLGSSEYAAVNIAAVVAVLVGAASALALATPLFLFLPVIGTIIALVALKQIRSSNGTQTGLSLAILALVLSFGLTAFTGAKFLIGSAREKADIQQLDELTANFGKLIANKQYAEAYKLTDGRFQEQVTPARFESLWEELAHAPGLGPLQAVRSTKLFLIDVDPESGMRMASAKAMFDTQQRSGETAFTTDVAYRNNADQWRIYNIPQLFAPKAPAAAGGGAGSGGAAPAPAGPAGPPAPR